MIAPQEWYEYQKQYQKYGLDMKPQRKREERNVRKRTRPFKKDMALVFGPDKKAALALIVMGCIIFVMIVVMTAYASSIRYQINKVEAQNETLWTEIKNLESKASNQSDMQYIEGKAAKKLGMVSASTANTVFITTDDLPEPGFADLIREKAY